MVNATVFKIVLVVMLPLLLCTCAILSQRSVSGQFAGLDAALGRKAEKNDGIIRLLVVHGIGEHQPGYADVLMAGLGPALRLAAIRPLCKPIPLPKTTSFMDTFARKISWTGPTKRGSNSTS